jgi:hypothetical protein
MLAQHEVQQHNFPRSSQRFAPVAVITLKLAAGSWVVFGKGGYPKSRW